MPTTANGGNPFGGPVGGNQAAGQVDESAFKNMWNFNLADAAFGYLVLEVQDGRIGTEMRAQGFNFAHRGVKPNNMPQPIPQQTSGPVAPPTGPAPSAVPTGPSQARPQFNGSCQPLPTSRPTTAATTANWSRSSTDDCHTSGRTLTSTTSHARQTPYTATFGSGCPDHIFSEHQGADYQRYSR